MIRPVAVAAMAIVLSFIMSGSALAQRNLKDIPPPDPELEQAAFEVHEGFEVNLFAADPRIAKPIQMNFDERGRLWVATSEIYPQIKPGQQADDKILVLEDTDRDGTADTTTVFARGLLIPTGVAPGDGGVYVANSTELIHLSDTGGDGRADRRRVVLSGFGTEDTHHILHTLRWGPDGVLYMNQSIYIHSHIETPRGVRRMNGGGVWRFRPETMELETFTLGLVNSWGHHFDRFGQSFQTDGAGGDGINYVFPGWVGITSPGAKRVMRGLNPGSPKHCGLEVLSGRHLPPDWRGSLITNDFRAHRVCRFTLSEDGSGFASRQQQELIKTSHVAFRPIDVKMGPDGAIYLADWYNPIIQHGEVDFRDPRRDHTHGRIWRITAKGRPLVDPPRLAEAAVPALFEALESPEQWTRHHAKRVLKRRGAEAVLPHLRSWIDGLDPQDEAYEHHLLEGLWTYQCLRSVAPALLERLLSAKDHRVRAAATRVIYHWHDRLPQPLSLLARQVEDEYPRVRLEAVTALSRIHDPQACEVAMRVLDRPLDKNLEFALWRTARELRRTWLPAFERGEIDFGGNVSHIAFALEAVESQDVVPLLLDRLAEGPLEDQEQQRKIVQSIAALATPEQFGKLVRRILSEQFPPEQQANLLGELTEISVRRKLRPGGELELLQQAVESPQGSLRAAALRAAGAWRVQALAEPIRAAALSGEASTGARQPAIEALALLGDPQSSAILKVLAAGKREAADPAIRRISLQSLASVEPQAAAPLFADVFQDTRQPLDPSSVVQVFLQTPSGPAALAAALETATLPADVAKLAVRTVRSSGQPHQALVSAISQAGSLKTGPRRLTPEQLEQLLAEIGDVGDAARGQAVYRQARLGCQKCHAIGGAGGLVGPDLSSIGASARPDYLVESLLEPGKKIKENYHSLVLQTDEGKVITGVKLRQTDDALILRDAEDRELQVPLDSIVAQKDGGSLMPAGLLDELTRRELVDLARFLSALGKVGGPMVVGKQRLVRRWEVLPPLPENYHQIGRKGFDTVPADNSELIWQSAYSRVDGSLPLAELPQIDNRRVDYPVTFARFEFDVTSPGKLRLAWNDAAGVSFWLDGKPVTPEPESVVEVKRGRHRWLVMINRQERRAGLSVELLDLPAGGAQVQLVQGK